MRSGLSVEDFVREHDGHDVRIYCTEIMDVTYYADCTGGTVSTSWEVKDSDVLETKSTVLGCRTCGITDGPEIPSDDIVVTL